MKKQSAVKLPPVKNLRGLLHYMEERQRIHLLRQQGAPPPWTKDPILQRFKFCNVYRNDDRQTRWLHDNWLKPYAEHPNLWFAVALFRMINLSDTCQEVGFPDRWEPASVLNIIEHRVKRGKQVFSGAYLIRSLRNGKGMKPYSIVWDVLNPLWESGKGYLTEDVWKGATLEGFHWWLMQHKGYGGFMAYEVVTDLRWTRYLNRAPDIFTWANAGPGAKRGLNRLYNRPTRQGLSNQRALEEMRLLYEWLCAEVDEALLPTLELRDVEHNLCESDKYQRARQALKLGQRIGLDVYRYRGVKLV